MKNISEELTNDWVEFISNPENQMGIGWALIGQNILPEGIDITDQRVMNICEKAKKELLTYSLTQYQMEKIAYFINDWLQLMGYGREYAKLLGLVRELRLTGFDFSKYYYINRVIN